MAEREKGPWPESGLRIEVAEPHLPAFFACLCLGTLHAIRARVIPPQVGIWALGPPWAAKLDGRVPDSIRDVLYETDEISAMAKLGTPQDVNAMLDDMIQRLDTALRGIEEARWVIKKVYPDGTVSSWPVDLNDLIQSDSADQDSDQ